MSRGLDISITGRTLSQVANPPDPLAGWQRRTLNLPAHVYLISFMMLLIIIMLLLCCHCYRMCRIAFRVRAHGLGALPLDTLPTSSLSTRKTPQAVIDQLPVTKYSSVYSKWQWRAHKADTDAHKDGQGALGDQQQQPSSFLGFWSQAGAGPAAAAAVAGGGPSRPSHARHLSWEGFTAMFQRQRQQLQQQRHSFGLDQLQQPPSLLRASLDLRSEQLPASNFANPQQHQLAAAANSTAAAQLDGCQSLSGLAPTSAGGAGLGAADAAGGAAALLQQRGGLQGAAAGPGPAAAPAEHLQGCCHSSGGSSTGGESLPCTICLEEFTLGEDIKLLPCRHFFHVGCINEWLQRDVTCPLCKQEVVAPDALAAAATAAGVAEVGERAASSEQEQAGRLQQHVVGTRPISMAQLSAREWRELIDDVMGLWVTGRLRTRRSRQQQQVEVLPVGAEAAGGQVPLQQQLGGQQRDRADVEMGSATAARPPNVP